MVAPRSFAFMTQRKPTGCASAIDELDQNAIGVSEILLRGRSSAPAERSAQTGHRAAMSYPRLVGHTDHAQASGEKFLNEIIFFVIKRGAAEMTDRSGVIDI